MILCKSSHVGEFQFQSVNSVLHQIAGHSLPVGSDLLSGVRLLTTACEMHIYVMADCSFSLALCTENKCVPTIYYLLVIYENLGISVSDTSKSMVRRKPKVCRLIIKLLLSLWLLIRIIIIIIITSIG